mmetsp:Transcript_5649/g.16225  ORF Transcript_5649/g.16225 Transcript_5649/m.16225 type:complete len:183 (+) Transcript_5649:285-833(+)|eukprot:CAMPEP_0172373480 /NCGR_PEP_ID=MMETSP1060-20121228/51792_1 /TAXON_ID=37318 /ORGANISM="Pseudo-nitzschia pungens, Strain cf. cingulata" /LENGTH=182 /DNA_ID=CAMNT_0013099829 /DNA_START=226 /DNA_END=774 /DNA_ORIENTATION=-
MRPLTIATILFHAALLLILHIPSDSSFQYPRSFNPNQRSNGSSQYTKERDNVGISTAYPTLRYDRSIQLSAGFLDDLQGFFKKFTTRASASHILIKGGAEAANKLEDLKTEIGDSPVAFAKAAAQYSACPSGRSGGDLGSFGPGAMVKEFDQVVFNESMGVVHGPIKTQFGYHLIYIRDRTE